MPKSDIEIDSSVFEQKARLLAKKLGKSEREFVKDQAGLLARDVAKMTPPYANKKLPSLKVGTSVGSKADIEAGENAIYWDLKKIYEVLPDDVIWKEHKHSKGGPIYRYGSIRSPGVITDVFKLHRWHRENRNSRGRTKKLKRPGIPWVGESLFTEYLKSQQASAGMAKACFLKASIPLRKKSTATPKIKRHLSRAKGSGRVIKDSKGSVGIISGKARGLSHVYRHIPELKKNRLYKAVKRGEILMREAAKDSNFKVV